MELELVSFDLCPFVQRSVITLNHKKADYKITYIDLANKPAWFLDISPLGKVPVLRVNGAVTLFESAVINEYLDETIGTPLMPKEPLKKALERAWIEYSSSLFNSFYGMSMEKDPLELDHKVTAFFQLLEKLEPVLQGGPYFRGSEFSLVDSSYAPVFTRSVLSEKLNEDSRWQTIPKVRKWAEELLKLPAVRESVKADFVEKFLLYNKAKGSLLF